jgi:carboxypeptidase Q
MAQARQAGNQRWQQSLQAASAGERSETDLHAELEAAGAAGIITSEWPGTPGVTRIFDASNRKTPTFELSCEDYGLVYRLAANGQGPVLRLTAESENLGEVPVYNVIGEIRGTEIPDQYVMLAAHLDSWDGSSGATDNGAGSLLMLEAMRVLTQAYPKPKRTILIALWSGEEQGLNGSHAFVEDHPDIVAGLQTLWNQDDGTGRIVNISAQGFVDAGGTIAKWLSQVPSEVSSYTDIELPGRPGAGSDYLSFVCAGAPGIPLGGISWDYGELTWHSNRDTYDKLVFDDLRNNVVLTASLAYLSSEDSAFVSRRERTVLTDSNGRSTSWPTCTPAARHSPHAGS